MKKIAFLMTAIIMFAASFLAAPSASAKSPVLPSKNAVLSMVPSSIVVEQTVTLSDGRTGSLFYKKTGDLCEVFSPNNLDGYEKSMIGSVVMEGKKLSSKDNQERSAYLAISKSGRPVVGISSSDKVADFAVKNDGSFFRQYPLLANGVLPPSFELHGKVPRTAIGKYSDEKLYYIVAPHNETMYDFADALREYGFSDVIYISGGDNYIFHRSPDGKPVIPAQTKEKIEKYTASPSPSPFLVFRNK